MRKAQLLIPALLLVLLLVACAPKTAPAPVSQVPAASAPAAAAPAPAAMGPSAPTKQAWQVEWENLLNAAQKEGKVVVYFAQSGTARTALERLFKDRYGIQMEFISGATSEIATRIKAEQRAGLYTVDLAMVSAINPVEILKPAGALEPRDKADKVLILPEVTDSKYWYEGLPWMTETHVILANLYNLTESSVFNTNLVKPGEVRGWQDLLNPKWKGKMVMHDPTLLSGVGPAGLGMAGEHIMGWDYVRKLAAQEPMIIKDTRLLASWVALGKYPIGVAIRSSEVAELITAGAPLEQVTPIEGAPVSVDGSPVALLTRAPHPNAARTFINWYLTKEGVMTFSKAADNYPGRLDISAEEVGMKPQIRHPGAKYPPNYTEEWILGGAERQKKLIEIFGKR